MDKSQALAILQAIAELDSERKRAATLAKQQQQFVPQIPHSKQQAFLDVDTLEALYGGSAGSGKALDIQTPVLTTEGWKTMETVVPGDRVFTPSGATTEVVAVSRVMRNRKCYRLEFQDGATIVADAGHLWRTISHDDMRRKYTYTDLHRAKVRARKAAKGVIERPRRKSKEEYLVYSPPPLRTTQELSQAVIVTKAQVSNHRIPVAQALRYRKSNLPIDPYILGLWLGDGTSSNGGFCTADTSIIKDIEKSGYTVNKRSYEYCYYILGLQAQLRHLGVLNNKHIPAKYLKASASQRLALLQGLMDTDGTCRTSDGSHRITSVMLPLAQGYYELLTGLGIKTRFREGVSACNDRVIRPLYLMDFTTEQKVFRLKRKLKNQRKTFRGNHKNRFLIACDPVPSTPVRCIQVAAEDGMFLCGRALIPTHNSSTLLMAALKYVHVPNYAALILRRTYRDLALPGALMDRAASWLRPTSARWKDTDKQWIFPSGATVTFGYMDTANDKYRYQGAEFQAIFIDEVTQWSEDQYTYLLSRIRRLKGAEVPLRMRAASNPGGIGHRWVYERFVAPASNPNRVFVPALMADNPSLDQESYIHGLEQLDAITKAQLLHGQWITDAGGLIYPMTDANRVAGLPDRPWLYALGVDIGASVTKPTTALTVVAFSEQSPCVYEVESAAHACGSPGDIAEQIRSVAARYPLIDIVVDPGGMGVGYIREFVQRYQLPVSAPADHRPPGTPAISKLAYRRYMRGDIEAGRLRTIMGANRALLDERGELRWNEAETDCAKGAVDHLTDSALYAYIRAYHFLHRDLGGPVPGSAEAIEVAMDAAADEESDEFEDYSRLNARHRGL